MTMAAQTAARQLRDATAQEIIFASVLGGLRWTVQLRDGDRSPGLRSGLVIDRDGTVIGDASDYIYGGRGFAIHTRSFAGYVPAIDVDLIG